MCWCIGVLKKKQRNRETDKETNTLRIKRQCLHWPKQQHVKYSILLIVAMSMQVVKVHCPYLLSQGNIKCLGAIHFEMLERNKIGKCPCLHLSHISPILLFFSVYFFDQSMLLVIGPPDRFLELLSSQDSGTEQNLRWSHFKTGLYSIKNIFHSD